MDEIARYWDAQAQRFDRAPDHGLRDPKLRDAWGSLLSGLLPRPPARVLGCGTGTLSVLLAERGHDVTGVDLAPEMIKLARAKAQAASVQIDFRLGDASEPQLTAGAFDVVLSRHVVWALPDPGRALAGWIRLLRGGGRLVFIEGRWSNGAGLSAAKLSSLIHEQGLETTVIPIDDPIYWGSPTDDERYVISSPVQHAHMP